MSDAPRRSLVTGGCGFTGEHLVDALIARGDEVTVVDAKVQDRREGVRYIEADLRDADAMAAACEGQTTVFHNASVVHTRQTGVDTVWAINLGGTRNVLEGCRTHGVRNFVYVSSASVVYEGESIENGDESLPYAGVSQAPYADSKIAAEKEVLAANDPDGVSTVSIRPHIIYGPGDRRFLPNILKRARAGKLKFAVGLRRRLSDFTYISNLVDGLILADEKLDPDSGKRTTVGGKPYFVTNGEPTAFFDFVGRVLAKMDLPPIRGAVPYRVAWTVAALVEAYDNLRGVPVGVESGMTRFAMRYMCTHHYFSIARAGQDLGYTPKVSIDEGIDRTVAHLRGLDAAPEA